MYMSNSEYATITQALNELEDVVIKMKAEHRALKGALSQLVIASLVHGMNNCQELDKARQLLRELED